MQHLFSFCWYIIIPIISLVTVHPIIHLLWCNNIVSKYSNFRQYSCPLLECWTFELRHDKPNKISVRPVTTDQPGHPLIRVLAVHMKKAWVLSYPLSAQQGLWSDWVDAQADLSLSWAHSHFVGFIMSRLISCLQTVERKFRLGILLPRVASNDVIDCGAFC